MLKGQQFSLYMAEVGLDGKETKRLRSKQLPDGSHEQSNYSPNEK